MVLLHIVIFTRCLKSRPVHARAHSRVQSGSLHSALAAARDLRLIGLAGVFSDDHKEDVRCSPPYAGTASVDMTAIAPAISTFPVEG